MIIIHEERLADFEFWSGGEDTAKALTLEQMREMENVLSELYPDGIDATKLNDIFWFEQDWIAENLGFKDWEELEEKNENE